MSAPISSMMERQVWSVQLDDPVAKVENVLKEHRLSWVPVIGTAGVVLGVISATDLLQFHAQERDATAVPAWQLCTYKPLSVDLATPVAEVARQMLERRIHHVVVTEHDSIAGVVSSFDFVRSFVSTH